MLQTKRLHFGRNLQRAKALRRKYLRVINKNAFLHGSIATGPLLNMRAGAGARFEHPRATPGISAIGDVSLQDTVHRKLQVAGAFVRNYMTSESIDRYRKNSGSPVFVSRRMSMIVRRSVPDRCEYRGAWS